jgi:hypothetical protein
VVRIPSLLVSGRDLLDPKEASSGANRDAVGVEHRLGEVSGSGRRIANSHVNNVPPISRGEEAAVGAGPPGVPGEGANGGGPEGSVVAVGFITQS